MLSDTTHQNLLLALRVIQVVYKREVIQVVISQIQL